MLTNLPGTTITLRIVSPSVKRRTFSFCRAAASISSRPALAGTVDELNRMAPLLDDHQIVLERSLQRGPENYRKLVRIGSYGSFVNYYICSLAVRVTDLQGRTANFPVFKQDGGRCEEN